MKFGCAFAYRLTRDAQGIIDVVRVGIGLARSAKEAAEFAVDIANVRRIEMTIDIEISRAAMLLSTNSVREFTKRIQISCIEECNAVLERESLSGRYLARNLV